jgi:hypothetical protein
MTDTKKTTPEGHPTAAQIKAWKEEYKGIFQIMVDGKKLILRKPEMKDLERAHAADPKKQKPFNFHRSIISNCKLYAEEGLLENDDNYFAACVALDEIIEVKEAEVKKL